jgi:hypothetical protein
MITNQFYLKEGICILQFPEKISKESYEDFQDWLNIELRMIKRRTIQPTIKENTVPEEKQ